MDAPLAPPLADGPAAPARPRIPGQSASPSASPRARHVAAPRAPAPASADAHANGPRLGELLGALSHALDLTAGQPAGHALRSCWVAQQLGQALGLGTTQLRDLYYATLLKDSGCSANAARLCELFLADDRSFKHDRKIAGTSLAGLLRFALRHTGVQAPLMPRLRALLQAVQRGDDIESELVETRCTRGAQIARQLRFGDDVADAIQSLDEHWDGSGHPQRLAGEEIPLYSRIALAAQLVDVFHASAGPQRTREEIARRRGRWLDPRVADVFAALARDPAFWRDLAADDLEDRILALEPAQQRQPVDEDYLDDIAEAFGQIVDAKSPFTAGHSTRVAHVAERVAEQLGLAPDVRRWLRRGALLHDIGKLGVSNTLLDKPGPLTTTEWAEMQRHAQYTEQILGRISAFGVLARVAGAHHERLDGGGYPRGLDARHIRLETRIITIADIYDALTADRPYRAAMDVPQALQALRDGVGITVDPDCLAALERALAPDGAI